MPHNNYFEIQADSYYDLGFKKGCLFKEYLLNAVIRARRKKNWRLRLQLSKKYFKPAYGTFPELINELQGYADGAKVSFDDLWVLNFEEELSNLDRCTTIVMNDGKMIAHNEDWDTNSKDSICILKKTIKKVTVLEIFYYNTLGGNSISVNSHGFVQAINTLFHTDHNVGIPRNVIARWMSETDSPERDFRKLSSLPRSAGYSHNLISAKGNIWNIESSALQQKIFQVSSPFIHTNHFLTELRILEKNNDDYGTFSRYNLAVGKTNKLMSLEGLKKLMSNDAKGRRKSIFNENTIGRMIIDLRHHTAHVWLLREASKGWLTYNLNFLL